MCEGAREELCKSMTREKGLRSYWVFIISKKSETTSIF